VRNRSCCGSNTNRPFRTDRRRPTWPAVLIVIDVASVMELTVATATAMLESRGCDFEPARRTIRAATADCAVCSLVHRVVAKRLYKVVSRLGSATRRPMGASIIAAHKKLAYMFALLALTSTGCVVMGT